MRASRPLVSVIEAAASIVSVAVNAVPLSRMIVSTPPTTRVVKRAQAAPPRPAAIAPTVAPEAVTVWSRPAPSVSRSRQVSPPCVVWAIVTTCVARSPPTVPVPGGRDGDADRERRPARDRQRAARSR